MVRRFWEAFPCRFLTGHRPPRTAVTPPSPFSLAVSADLGPPFFFLEGAVAGLATIHKTLAVLDPADLNLLFVLVYDPCHFFRSPP